MRAFATEEKPAEFYTWLEKNVNFIKETLVDGAMWQAVAMQGFKILLIIVICRLAVMILNRAVDRFAVTSTRRKGPLRIRKRRVQTLSRLLKNVISYTLNFIAILLVLGELNIQVGPLLAGAGVIGLAIGFGAQSLVKDVITGFFIVFEDQFSVGDVIQTGAYKGTVEMIGLRSTRIATTSGEVHIIPNGSILAVTNFSVNPAVVTIDLPIALNEHTEPLLEYIRSALLKMNEQNMIGTPVLEGIQTLTENQITVRITARCKPNTNEETLKAINAAIKQALETRHLAEKT